MTRSYLVQSFRQIELDDGSLVESDKKTSGRDLTVKKSLRFLDVSQQT